VIDAHSVNLSPYAWRRNMAIGRVIRREILDHLPADDPSALRGRRDLRTINALMGNVRWMRRALRRATKRTGRRQRLRLIELGAGDGRLCRKVSRWFPTAAITGLDLVPRPDGLPDVIFWRQGDLLDRLPDCEGDGLFGVMILHHFPDEKVARIGQMAGDYRMLCFCEPWRARFPHLLGLLMRPFCGAVTRHDLHASIDAGFVPGELPGLLGLRCWKIEESVDWRGSLRLVAWKE
jgi:hypothetical protein